MKNKVNKPFMLIIYGPTGVGKTETALTVAQHIPSEIINMDVGQFYTPLSIGTAKPDWKNNPTPHHLFDIIDTPINYTVSEYRTLLYKTVHEVIQRGNLPILVGGSGFYLHALLYLSPTAVSLQSGTQLKECEDWIESLGSNLWKELYTIDPVRAAAIDKSDEYRIKRALSIWHATGNLPSSYAPVYKPEVDYMLLFVERDRQELKTRINMRVHEMLDSGWIDETRKLIDTPWQAFIQKKNLIGYAEIFDYLLGKQTPAGFAHMVETISAKTRQYAKRQFTFWRKLEREIKKEKQYTGTSIGCLDVVNLTDTEIHSYIGGLLKKIESFR